MEPKNESWAEALRDRAATGVSPISQHHIDSEEEEDTSLSESVSSGWFAANADMATSDRAMVDQDVDCDKVIDDMIKEYQAYNNDTESHLQNHHQSYADEEEPEQHSHNADHHRSNGISHYHIIFAAASTYRPLITNQEKLLLSRLKTRKDEVRLGFPSPPRGFNPYLGPACLRNGTLDRLAQFLNSGDIWKGDVADEEPWVGSPEDKRQIRVRALMKTLYARAIRDKETEAILEEQCETGSNVVRKYSKSLSGAKVMLNSQTEIQPSTEENVVPVEILKRMELEKKTEGMGPGERRVWLRKVYGARWTWFAARYELDVALEPGDVVIRTQYVGDFEGFWGSRVVM
jgi:hypothetical protein